MALVIATAPATEPVSTAEAKSQLRVDVSDDDTLIGTYVTAARQWVEHLLRRALITQTWDLFLDEWPAGGVITVPLPPLQSVSGIYYTADGSAEATWSSGNYLVDAKSEPGRVLLQRTASWPSDTLEDANGVRVRFVAGYGAAAAVPQPIKQAILLLVGHYYENREAVVIGGAIPKEVPLAAQALLSPYRVYRWV